MILVGKIDLPKNGTCRRNGDNAILNFYHTKPTIQLINDATIEDDKNLPAFLLEFKKCDSWTCCKQKMAKWTSGRVLTEYKPICMKHVRYYDGWNTYPFPLLCVQSSIPIKHSILFLKYRWNFRNTIIVNLL